MNSINGGGVSGSSSTASGGGVTESVKKFCIIRIMLLELNMSFCVDVLMA